MQKKKILLTRKIVAPLASCHMFQKFEKIVHEQIKCCMEPRFSYLLRVFRKNRNTENSLEMKMEIGFRYEM